MSYDIVYSITAHESIECVYDLYENIMRFHHGLDCLVLFHVNPLLYSQINSIPVRHNLWFYPQAVSKQRFGKSILLAHLENFAMVQKMDFKLFGLLASNCLFVRNVDFDMLKSQTPTLGSGTHEFQQEASVNFENIEQEWFWSVYLKCQGVRDLFEKHKIGVNARCHEGAYLRKDLMGVIYEFCKDNIIGKINLIDGLDWIEIVLPSLEKYLTGSIGARYCKHFPFTREIAPTEIMEMAGGTGMENIVKRVERSMDSGVRKFIHDL